MVFSSLPFLFLFLPVFLAAYFVLPWREARNAVLVVGSLIFYAWGEPVWVLMLLGSATVDFANGLFIERFRGSRWAVLGVWSTLIFNLGLFIAFKYSDFIIDNLNAVTGAGWRKPGLMLPVGMSFYTFETISYTLDVYSGAVPAQRSFRRFLVFICAFPRLVAGPIVRYGHVARDIEGRVWSLTEASAGAGRFCRGLFKKVAVANVAGQLTAQFLDKDPAQMTLAGGWFGLLMFTLQIYYDFSGYSDMAIGLGWILGFHYHENFQHPYASRSITDFWRRWHISLGAFFRDYVYIPLGGNRHHAVRNIFLVWALTGIWHGASWNFLLWGLYFGVLLFLEKRLLLACLARLPAVAGHVYALTFIILGWSLFHFTDLGRLGRVLSVLFGLTPSTAADPALVSALRAHVWWLAAALAFALPLRPVLADAAARRLPAPLLRLGGLGISLAALGVSVVLLVGSSYNPFIYFRF